MTTCDMTSGCEQPIAYIDQKGYVYCNNHGLSRQMSQPCRKLRPHELARLARGETIRSY